MKCHVACNACSYKWILFVDSADFVLALSSECSTGGGVRLPLGLSIKIQGNDFTVSLSSIKFRFICANYTDI